MKCPSCGNEDTRVVDSRALNEGMAIRRRRVCEKCDFRFSTHEEIELLNLKVKKRDNGARKMVTPNEIMAMVGDYFGVGVGQLKGERRTKTVAWARQITMYLLREDMKLAQEEVGRLLGDRDHTTVLYAEGKIRLALEEDEKLRGQLSDMRRKLLIAS